MDEKQEIPKEIDDHFKLFGKEPWEIEYGDKCPLCNSRFDEFEGCANNVRFPANCQLF